MTNFFVAPACYKSLDIIGCAFCNLTIARQRTSIAPAAGGLGFVFAPAVGFLFFAVAIFMAVPGISAEPSQAILTNALDVISLPAESASRSLKVKVIGVVTAADPGLQGRFFMQDATSGVFVDNVNGPRVQPGDRVEVSGITYAGAFAPTITAPNVIILGHVPLPDAKAVKVEELMSGADDSQRIEISAFVRDARKESARVILDLVAGGYRFRAYLSDGAFSPAQLMGAEVRLRGTAAEAHNRSLRQLIAVEIYIPSAADLVLVTPEGMDPFARPIIPLNQLAQYRPGNSLAQRVHVRGVCTLHSPDNRLFVEDSLYGLQIQTAQPFPILPGDAVEAVGFLNFENYHPVLQDAIVRKSSAPLARIHSRSATIAEIQSGYYHGSLVTLSGKLVEHTMRPGFKGSPESQTTTLVLQSSNFTFAATARGFPDQARLRAIPLGSVVQVDGVCFTEIDSDGKLEAFQILLPSPGSVLILQQPSWFTPQHLFVCMMIAGIALVIIAGRLVLVARKNSILNLLVREREKAQLALQQANDQLEERVKERTAQLKFEVSARKEAEVRFKAVLSERTRLAQELHDTVEQTLTGIALQMDVASKLHDDSPQNSLHHLELARSLMAKSKEEVRQSIWDLRSRALEQFDLANALAEGARQATAGANIPVHFETRGPARLLPEIIEENLLRIGQEAATNVIKHSHATELRITLLFEPGQVVLQIQDNGLGFDRQCAAGPQQGHFGLLGMSERAKRVRGRLEVESVPGKGTTVSVKIPLELPQDSLEPVTSQKDALV